MLDMYDAAVSEATFALEENSEGEWCLELLEVIKKSKEEKAATQGDSRLSELIQNASTAMDEERWNDAVTYFTQALETELDDRNKSMLLGLRARAYWRVCIDFLVFELSELRRL